MSVLHLLATSIVCMNLRTIAVLKNSRDCVLSPSSMIFFRSLNDTFDRARVRISTAGLWPLVASVSTLFASFSIFASVAASRSRLGLRRSGCVFFLAAMASLTPRA